MQTSGHGNDSLLILVPVGVSVIVGVVIVGGPANALDVVNAVVRDVAHQMVAIVSAWF